jgi:hypothetical protein
VRRARGLQAALGLVVGLLLVPGGARAQTPRPGPILGEREVARTPGGMVERDTVKIAPARGVKIKRVTVDNRLGDVDVVGHDEAYVALTVVKRAPDGTTLDRLKVNLVAEPDGTVDIGAALVAAQEARPVPARAVRIDISLEMPRSAHVEVRAWNGKIAVSGVHAGATLSAHAADLTVTDVRGPVVTDAARGTQRLSGVKGDVDAEAAYGDLDLDGIAGHVLAARVHTGQLTATRVRSRKVTMRTTFGDIHFTGELLAGSSVDIASYGGSVEVRLPRGGGLVRIDASSERGRVESRVELAGGSRDRGRLVGSHGRGGKPVALRVSSVVGDVSLGLVDF